MTDALNIFQMARPQTAEELGLEVKTPVPMRRTRGRSDLGGIDQIPMSPADPRWREKIPPPEPDGTQRAAPAAAPMIAPAAPSVPAGSGGKRLSITFGPGRGTVMVAVESPPDWDADEVYELPVKSLAEVMPLLRHVVKVKDLTGRFRAPTPKQPAYEADLPLAGDGAEGD